MISLFKKEISIFFGSSIGYIIIGLFLITNSLVLWSSYSQFNILDYGYANMDMFFYISPLLLLLFIPALSMRIFSEEYNSGTIETLLTKPISIFKIVLSKFLAVFSLVFLAILPTMIFYVTSIYFIGETVGNIDLASIFGSYIGLILLSALFISISIFTSSQTSSQITSFITAIILCLLFYYGFDLLSEISFINDFDLAVKKCGISYHYSFLSKGLIRLSDLIYFFSMIFFFLKINTDLIINKK
jgi:ABC-2 type transport system permease protein